MRIQLYFHFKLFLSDSREAWPSVHPCRVKTLQSCQWVSAIERACISSLHKMPDWNFAFQGLGYTLVGNRGKGLPLQHGSRRASCCLLGGDNQEADGRLEQDQARATRLSPGTDCPRGSTASPSWQSSVETHEPVGDILTQSVTIVSPQDSISSQ